MNSTTSHKILVRVQRICGMSVLSSTRQRGKACPFCKVATSDLVELLMIYVLHAAASESGMHVEMLLHSARKMFNR